MRISKIEKYKAKEFVKLLSQLDNETKFMLFEPGERTITVKQMEYRLNNNDDSKELLIGAEEDNELIGFISVSRGKCHRTEHTAYIAIGIIQEHSNKGIGKALFEEVEKWAFKYSVNRLELTVMTHNERGIKLYERIGFKKEGLREKSMIIDGEYKDEYYMAKLI